MSKLVGFLCAYAVITALRITLNYLMMRWIARREVLKLDHACAESFDNVSVDFDAVFERLNTLTKHAEGDMVKFISSQGNA